MKRKLRKLLMVAIAIFSICGSAEARSNVKTPDESPMPTPAEPAAVEASGATFEPDDVPEGVYYFRNTQAGAFMAGSNSWGTRLSLKSAGDQIQITKKVGMTNAYDFEDVSLVIKDTGSKIGPDPRATADDPRLWLDQSSPNLGYTFHKLTAEEIAAIDEEEGSSLADGKGKEYYFISYINRMNKLVYLMQGNIGEAGHTEVTGFEVTGALPPASAVWEILTREQLIEDLYENAKQDSPMSATPLMVNADFSRNLGDHRTASNFGWTDERGISQYGGEDHVTYLVRVSSKAFNVYQTITDLPNGDYKFVAYGVYEGNKNGSGTNPRFYVKDANTPKYSTFKNVSTTGSSIGDWAKRFMSADAKNYRLDTIAVTVWDNTLTIGFEGGRTDISAFFDNVQLFYYGRTADIGSLVKKYSELVEQAKSLYKSTKPMGSEYRNALQLAILNISPDQTDAESLNNAIDEYQEIISNAQNSQMLYSELATKYQTEVDKLGTEAQEYYHDNITVPIIEAEKLTNESQLKTGLKIARIMDSKGKDVTKLEGNGITTWAIENPSFEDGITGWTVDGDMGAETKVANIATESWYNYSGMDQNRLYNTWWLISTDLYGGASVHQTLTNLPSGTYTLKAVMATATNLYAHLTAGSKGNTGTNIGKGDNTGVDMSVDFSVDDVTDEVEITAWASNAEDAVLSGNDKTWFKVDNFHLIYNGPKDLSELKKSLQTEIDNAKILLRSKMNENVRSELVAARQNAETVIQQNNEKAINSALVVLKAKNKAAQASVTVYENINTILQKGNNNLDEAGKTAFQTYVKEVQQKWTDGLITDGTDELTTAQNQYVAAIKQQDTPGIQMTEAINDWECNSGYKAGDFDFGHRTNAVVKGWEILHYGDNAIADKFNSYNGNPITAYFHVNTWSKEAETHEDGGTPMSIPYTQFWSDGERGEYILPYDHVIIRHEGETGYRPGRYTLSINARLRLVNPDDHKVTGYTFVANGYNSKTKFTKYADGWFYANDEIDFYVKEDGNIDFQFDLDHPNFYWIAYKMIKLVYQGNTVSEDEANDLIAEATANYIPELCHKDIHAELVTAIQNLQNEKSINNLNALRIAIQNVKKSAEIFNVIEDEIAAAEKKAADYGFDTNGQYAFEQEIKKLTDAINDSIITTDYRGLADKAWYTGLLSQMSGDFTCLLTNPGFETGDLTGWTVDYINDGSYWDNNVHPTNYNDETYGIQWINGRTHVDGSAPLYNNLFNSWTNNNGERGGRIQQTVKNLPNGKYRVSAYVSAHGNNSVFLFANEEHSEPCYPGASKYYAAQTSVEVTITNGEITFGAIGGVDEYGNVPGGVFPDFPNVLGAFFKCDAFTLEYVGPASQEDKYKILMASCAYADQYKDQPMNGDIRKQLMTVYNKAKATTANSDADLLETLNQQLIEYTNNCLPSIEIYKQVNAWIEKADNLDESGQLAFQKIAKNVIKAYNNRTITDGQSEMDILEDKLRIATKAQTEAHTDWTGAIYNPSFENKNAHWAPRDGFKSFETVKVSGDGTTRPWNNVTGNRYAYKNNTNDTPIKLSYEQKVDSIRKGLYKLKVTVYTTSSTMKVFGNSLEQTITKCSSLDEVREIEQIIVVNNEDYINLGIVGDLKAKEEIRVDNFRLEYISKDIDISEEAVPEGVHMYYKTRQAQTDAVLKFKMKPQPEVISAAVEAIQKAKASAELYATAKFYLDSCRAYMQKSNVYTADVKAHCKKILDELEAGWENGTLKDEDMEDYLYEIFQNGFEGFDYTNADNPEIYEDYNVLNYMFSAWWYKKEKDNEYIKADGNFKVNNWSELVSKTNPTAENSEMTTPYMEYWRDSNVGPLENAVIHAKAIDLQKGKLYKAKVLTRVLNESGTVAPDEFKGITMHVTTDRIWHSNGKAVNESDTIDICKGEIHRDDNFNVVSQVFEIDSIVVRTHSNGDADFYFTVNETNANWLNWKFCQFDTIRTLKPYEEDDPATDKQIAHLWELIKRDEQKPIGFNVSEYSVYENKEMIQTHNFAKNYLTKNSGKTDGRNDCSSFIVDSLTNILEDESKWKIQNEDVNCVYNANFWLVPENEFGELIGWTIHDTSVEFALTGGIGASSATADKAWAKFNNTEGSKDANGNPLTNSTAASFYFPEKPSYFCSSSSKYTYGEDKDYIMPLDPDQAYTFSAQLGYLNPDERGSITFEVVNVTTGHVVETIVKEPKICVSDTVAIPETFQVIFHTAAASSGSKYNNSLENYDNLEKYMLRVSNTNTKNYWTMVISNIKLYRWPNARMYIAPNAHWGTFIAPFETKIPKGITAKVVIGKADKSHTYIDPSGHEGEYTSLFLTPEVKNVKYKSEDGVIKTWSVPDMNKSGKIPAHTPVVIYTSDPKGYDGIASGTKHDERLDSVRWYKLDENSDEVYLEGYEGIPDINTPNKMLTKPSQNGWYVLQKHADEMQACLYLIRENTAHPDIPANRCYLVDPTYSESNPGRIRKFIFDMDETIEMTTNIENSDNQNQEIEIIGIYSLDGTPQKTFKPGINILKMSDGTTRKKFIQ